MQAISDQCKQERHHPEWWNVKHSSAPTNLVDLIHAVVIQSHLYSMDNT